MDRARLIRVAVVAVLIFGSSLLLGYLFFGLNRPEETQPSVADLAQERQVAILVASGVIERGTALDIDNTRWVDVGENTYSAFENSFIARGSGDTDSGMYQAGGHVAILPIEIGAPILKSHILKAGEGGFLANTVKPGMRAVTLAVAGARAGGGFLRPRDRVDVVLTLPNNEQQGGARTRTVLSDVLVLAVGNDLSTGDTPDGRSPANSTTITLELSPSDARAVLKAQAEGSVQTVIRPFGSDAPEEVRSNTVEVVRLR